MKKIVIINKGVSATQVAQTDGCCAPGQPADVR